MEELTISQSELARRVGVSQTTIYKLVSGEGYGSKYLHKIARELQTTAAYLSGETDDPNSDFPDEHLDFDEQRWVWFWRRLDEKRQKSFVNILEALTGEPESTLHDGRQAYTAEA